MITMITTDIHQLFERQKLLGAILLIKEIRRAYTNYEYLANLLRDAFYKPDGRLAIKIPQWQMKVVEEYLNQLEDGAEKYAISQEYLTKEYSPDALLKRLSVVDDLSELEQSIREIGSSPNGELEEEPYRRWFTDWVESYLDQDFEVDGSEILDRMYTHAELAPEDESENWHENREHIYLLDTPEDSSTSLSDQQQERIVATIMRNTLNHILQFRTLVHRGFDLIYKQEANWDKPVSLDMIATGVVERNNPRLQNLTQKFKVVVDMWDTTQESMPIKISKTKTMPLSSFVDTLYHSDIEHNYHHLHQLSGRVYNFFDRLLFPDLEQTIN